MVFFPQIEMGSANVRIGSTIFGVVIVLCCRLNSPQTSVVSFEVFGYQLQFSQHLGTTVWDASMVFVKYLEKNCRKGKFCSSKLKGKRVIELGAGCGVAGFVLVIRLGWATCKHHFSEILTELSRRKKDQKCKH